jgi:hypothetical protein
MLQHICTAHVSLSVPINLPILTTRWLAVCVVCSHRYIEQWRSATMEANSPQQITYLFLFVINGFAFLSKKDLTRLRGQIHSYIYINFIHDQACATLTHPPRRLDIDSFPHDHCFRPAHGS